MAQVSGDARRRCFGMGLSLGGGQDSHLGRHSQSSAVPRRRAAVQSTQVAVASGARRAGHRWWRQRSVASRAAYLCFAQRTQPPGCGVGFARPGSLPGRLRLAGTDPGSRWWGDAAGYGGAGLTLVLGCWAALLRGRFLLRDVHGLEHRFFAGRTGASYRLRLGAGGGREVAALGERPDLGIRVGSVVLAASVAGCRLRGISARRWADSGDPLNPAGVVRFGRWWARRCRSD